eukprot:TRINITY_DN8142_c0_g2_i1.p1 TRINITY_DN8142_c0_g2~~TRINITY_DN8142_c0_g2_i1.p1  ORF type:complete len:374 (-),score=42.47 TRINITY_DN8142_c0_g2_i1:40-1107(-)
MAPQSSRNSQEMRSQQTGQGRLRRRVQKTKLCWFFRRGSCAGQDMCPFVHDEEERRGIPQNPSEQPCWHWSKGYCRMGAECKFVHVGPPGAAAAAPEQQHAAAAQSGIGMNVNPYAYFGGYSAARPTISNMGHHGVHVGASPGGDFQGASQLLGADALSPGRLCAVFATVPRALTPSTTSSTPPLSYSEEGFPRCTSPMTAASFNTSEGGLSTIAPGTKRCTSPGSAASSGSTRSISPTTAASWSSEAEWRSESLWNADPIADAKRRIPSIRTLPGRTRQASPPRVSEASAAVPTSPVIGAYEGWVLTSEDSASCPLVQLGDAWTLTVRGTFLHVLEAEPAVPGSSRKRAASASA